MKKLIIGITFILAAIIASAVWTSCKKEEVKGKIYGTVTDYATGEPIGNVNVKLRPSGETTLTGSDGSYQFDELDAGKYSLLLSKAEYADLDDDYVIDLKVGVDFKRDVQMRKRIASLKILDMSGNPLDTLNYGSDESVVIKSFNLFNEGTEVLECTPTYECEWISNVAGLESSIQPGQTVTVTVRIDRVALADGDNTTFLYITSGNGSNQIVVKATFMGTAVITTTEPIDVTANSVTVGGRISDDGGRPVLSRGICYGTSQTPDIDGTHTQDGADTGSFSHNITGLASSTTYYARAYATNRNGTYYASNIVSFTTENGLPTVTTTNVSNITATTAKSGGNVTNNGGYAVTARGVCWNTLGSPEVDNDPHTTNGNGNGSFSSNLTELAAGTTYHVRAYATNQQGTAYGPEVEFSTMSGVATITLAEATNVTASTATCSANITNDGGASITERGFCWATSQYPTTTNSHSAVGSGTGEFSSSLINLAPGETYYLRAYAISSVGTSYSNQVSFTTGNGKPVVTTTGVSNITATTAKTGGNVTDNGGYDVTARGVCWNTLGNPDINDQHTTNGSGNGSFTSNLSGLTAGTTYHVRAYATNQQGTSYGPEEQFSTLNGNATITLNEATNITATTATCSANITDDGGANISERGFCWATSQYPTTTSNHSAVGTGTGSYSVSLINLTPGATYYVRAYAVNTTGTSYSNQISFSTASGVATVTTGSITNVLAYSATGSVTVSNAGGTTLQGCGICWSETHNPTIDNNVSSGGSQLNTAYTCNMLNLSPNTTYYVRAYATTNVETSYGAERSFQTTSGAPSISLTVSNVLTKSFGVTSNITSDGGYSITSRGFCWSSTNIAPTVSDSHIESGTGTGSFSNTIANLQANTTYYVRAYATNSVGTFYSDVRNQTTGTGLQGVHFGSTTASNITASTAKCSVVVDYNYSDVPVVSEGCCWSSTTNTPTINDAHTDEGTSTSSFNSILTNLSPSTRYYVRAYITTSYGTSYSASSLSFTTTDGLPTVTTNEITTSNVTSSSFTCGGNVTNAGDSPVTARGICWSTAGTPTVSDAHSTDGSGTGTFSHTVTGVSPQTQTYYVRAYATNQYGTAYGETVVQSHSNPYHLPITTINGTTFMIYPQDLGQMYWSQANSVCEDLSMYGFDDWRLFTLTEAASLHSAGSKEYFTAYTGYWTSNKYIAIINQSGNANWYSGAFTTDDSNHMGNVRPIRIVVQ